MNKKDKKGKPYRINEQGAYQGNNRTFAAIVFIILEIYSVCLMPVKSLSMFVISILSGCVVLWPF